MFCYTFSVTRPAEHGLKPPRLSNLHENKLFMYEQNLNRICINRMQFFSLKVSGSTFYWNFKSQIGLFWFSVSIDLTVVYCQFYYCTQEFFPEQRINLISVLSLFVHDRLFVFTIFSFLLSCFLSLSFSCSVLFSSKGLDHVRQTLHPETHHQPWSSFSFTDILIHVWMSS